MGTPSSTGLSLPVSGTVAQIQSAFSTPIERYHLASGKTGYDNKSAPQVPVTVAPQIQGILGLNTLSPPKPSTSVPQASPAARMPAVLRRCAGAGPGPTLATAGHVCDQHRRCPDWRRARCRPVGAGVLVRSALLREPLRGGHDRRPSRDVGRRVPAERHHRPSPTATASLSAARRSHRRTSTAAVQTGGATVEAELDIETVLSLAPKANIEVYEGGTSDSIYNVFSRIVSDDTAKIVSASWTNGCEAYVRQSYQNSENTLFQAAAAEGQSIFVATGDQGSQGCNVNGVIDATTGGDPVAQAVDTSTGTLYIANKTSNSVSVDSEGGTNASNAGTASSVSTGTGSGPDAVALDSSDHKVFVANAGGTLTVFSSSTCNQTTTSGCGSPTQIASGGHLSSPDGARRERVHALCGEQQQRHRGGVQRIDERLDGNRQPSVLLGPLRTGRRRHQRLRLRRRPQQRPDRVLQRLDLQRDDAQRVVAQRRPRSPSATLRSPSPSPAAPATSMWPTPGAVAESRW